MDFPLCPTSNTTSNGIPINTVPINLIVITNLIVHNKYISGATTTVASMSFNQGIFHCFRSLKFCGNTDTTSLFSFISFPPFKKVLFFTIT